MKASFKDTDEPKENFGDELMRPQSTRSTKATLKANKEPKENFSDELTRPSSTRSTKASFKANKEPKENFGDELMGPQSKALSIFGAMKKLTIGDELMGTSSRPKTPRSDTSTGRFHSPVASPLGLSSKANIASTFQRTQMSSPKMRGTLTSEDKKVDPTSVKKQHEYRNKFGSLKKPQILDKKSWKETSSEVREAIEGPPQSKSENEKGSVRGRKSLFIDVQACEGSTTDHHQPGKTMYADDLFDDLPASYDSLDDQTMFFEANMI